MTTNPHDFKVEVFSDGGSWVRKYQGVAVTHIPTGITIRWDKERSQHANRARAFEMLLAKLAKTDYAKQMELF